MKILKFGGSSLQSSSSILRIKEIIEAELKDSKALFIVSSAIYNATDSIILAALKSSSSEVRADDFKELEPKVLKLSSLEIISALQKSFEDIFLSHFNESKDKAKGLITDSFSLLNSKISELEENKACSKKELDFLMSQAEELTSKLLEMFLSENLKETVWADAKELIFADNNYSKGKVEKEKTAESIKNFRKNNNSKITVTAGFIATSLENEVITLGRGGSDYTAALLAEALDAKNVQIWTTVDGIMTADPEKVSRALSIPALTYKEAMELSHFGARVLYAPTLLPAYSANIPVLIKNSKKPELAGTIIKKEKDESTRLLTGISAISNLSLLQIEGSGLVGVKGTAERVFKALSSESINVILISQASSEHSICLAINQSALKLATAALEKEFSEELGAGLINPVKAEEQMSVLAVVGENMRHSPGLSRKVFQALGQNGINAHAIAQGSSELNLSIVVSGKDEIKGLNALHDAFFYPGQKTINLFCVGTGQIGSTLLEQLKEHSSELKKKQGLELKVVGLANSKKFIIEKDGLELSKWPELLKDKSQSGDINSFLKEIYDLNLPNSIFIDNSAHTAVSDHYEDILLKSISIVTPNKKANSSSYERFLNLQKIAGNSNVNFFYETNVGAGLPVIETLKDLMRSGDEVISIEAVLSGTLSYIFNSYDGSESFSEVVKNAKESGYTEPDPRDDLSGMDVARKLLILGREMGLPIEEKDIEIESLIPEVTKGAKSADEFLEKLPLADKEFETTRSEAASLNKKLVYLAKISQENNKTSASVSLQAVSSDHPFSSLSGSDNIISFRTKRYDACPLVVKGPGAGTQVTAAGVFADIIKAASYLL